MRREGGRIHRVGWRGENGFSECRSAGWDDDRVRWRVGGAYSVGATDGRERRTDGWEGERGRPAARRGVSGAERECSDAERGAWGAERECAALIAGANGRSIWMLGGRRVMGGPSHRGARSLGTSEYSGVQRGRPSKSEAVAPRRWRHVLGACERPNSRSCHLRIVRGMLVTCAASADVFRDPVPRTVASPCRRQPNFASPRPSTMPNRACSRGTRLRLRPG
jgi:hypothetical protein